jgi:hypothetical protein
MPEAQTREASLPMQVRAMPIGSIDEANRTVDVVFSTGAAVRRHAYSEAFGRYMTYEETLAVTRAAINLDRLNAGAAVVDSHSVYSVRSQFAVVDKAWVDGDQAMARLRFPSEGIDPEADRLWGKVREKIVRNISVGYIQDKVRLVEPAARDQVGKMIVERWTPYEISFVTVGADPGAQTRGAPPHGAEPLHPATIIVEAPNEETRMPGSAPTPAGEPAASPSNEPAATPAERAAPDAAAAVDAAVKAERKRVEDIVALCRKHEMDDEFVAARIKDGSAADAVGALILDALAARSAATDVGTAPSDKPSAERKSGLATAVRNMIDAQSPRRANA